MSEETAEALAEAHEAYVAALLAHVTDEGGGGGAAAADDDDDDEAETGGERRTELSGLGVVELRKIAKTAGASAADIKKCGTGNDGKTALVDLILTLEEPDAAPEKADDEDEPPAKSKKDKKKDKKKNKK